MRGPTAASRKRKYRSRSIATNPAKRRRIWHGGSVRTQNRLNTAQKVVIVVALGFALIVFGLYVNTLGRPIVGWVGYAPLTSSKIASPSTGWPGWVRLIIWLALTAIWASSSVMVLQSTRDGRAERD